jgi:aryl-alcohol dehydrogenase-like predicted oxidoreductase
VKIALGTVQFGLKYGISNTHGKTDQSSVNQILQYACNNGIDTIDTAVEYGESEKIIGNFAGNDCNWNIVTKIPLFAQESIENEHAKQLKQYFDNSLLNLNKKRIYGLLMHSCNDLFKHNGELLFKKMEKLKSCGLVEKIGVSAYSKQEIDQILDNFEIDLIQVPASILDQRLINDGSLSKLKKYGVEIHVRSIFLQGLLLMERKRIPSYFLPIKKNLDAFDDLAKMLNLTRLELALGYVMGISSVDKIVLGVNNLSQLKEIVNVQPLQNNLDIFKGISIDNPIYTNPSLWKI